MTGPTAAQSGHFERVEADRERAEVQFLCTYDPVLDEPVEPPTPRPPRYQVRPTARFVEQVRRLGSPRYPLEAVR